MRVGWECKWGWRPVCKYGPSLNTTNTTTQHYLLLLRLLVHINEVQPCRLTNDSVMIRVLTAKPSEGMTFTRSMYQDDLYHPYTQVKCRFFCEGPLEQLRSDYILEFRVYNSDLHYDLIMSSLLRQKPCDFGFESYASYAPLKVLNNYLTIVLLNPFENRKEIWIKPNYKQKVDFDRSLVISHKL